MKTLSDYLGESMIDESVVVDDNVMNSILDALAPHMEKYIDGIEKNANGPHKKDMLTFAQRVRDTWRDEFKNFLLTEHDKNDGKTIGHNWSTIWAVMGKWKDLNYDRITDEEIFAKSSIKHIDIEFEYGDLVDVSIRNISMSNFVIVIQKFKPNKKAKDLAKGAATGGSLGSGLFDMLNTEISKGDTAVGTNKSLGYLVYGKVVATGGSKVTLQNEYGKSLIEPENLVVLITASGKSIDASKLKPRKL